MASLDAKELQKSLEQIESTQHLRGVDWAGPQPHDAAVEKLLKTVFKLEKFRTNQREILNATLSGSDVFVIMPAGKLTSRESHVTLSTAIHTTVV